MSSGSHPGAGELAPCISSSGVSICTFVLVKQVNCAVIQAPANRPPAAPQVSVPLQRLLRCQCFRQHTSAYVSTRQHTSAYASTFTLQRLLRCQCFGTLVPVSKYFVPVKQVSTYIHARALACRSIVEFAPQVSVFYVCTRKASKLSTYIHARALVRDRIVEFAPQYREPGNA